MRLSYNVKRNLGQYNDYNSKYNEEENDVELKGDVELDFNDERHQKPPQEIEQP